MDFSDTQKKVPRSKSFGIEEIRKGGKKSKEELLLDVIEGMEEKIHQYEIEVERLKMKEMKMIANEKRYQNLCLSQKRRNKKLEEELEEAKNQSAESLRVYDKVERLQLQIEERENSEERLIEENRKLKNDVKIARDERDEFKKILEEVESELEGV